MIRSAFMAPAGSTLGGGLWPTDPPTGDPFSASAYTYGDDEFVFVGLSWAYGDGAAYTEMGYSNDPGTEPGFVWDMAPPLTTNWETERAFSTTEFWWVRHTRGGTPGAWVRAP